MNTFNLYWHQKNHERLVGASCSSDFLDQMTEKLSQVLENKLVFNFQNCTSPAALDNEYIIPEELRPIIEQNAHQHGRLSPISDLKYLICETRDRVKPKLATWMYNDEHKNIILEIGEQFEWPDLPDDEEFRTTDPIVSDFFKFIENYKPTIKTIIPQAIAQAWLTQVQELFDLMNYNEIAQCEDCMHNLPNDKLKRPQVHMKQIKK